MATNTKFNKNIWYYANGTIEREYYYQNNQLHRNDGPALIEYYKNGTIKAETYYRNDQLHRDDDPAIILYLNDGTIKTETYYQNGQLHRDDGPAHIEYNENSVAIRAIGYIKGKETNVLYDLNGLHNHRTPLYKPVL